jgi:hypothetical protein
VTQPKGPWGGLCYFSAENWAQQQLLGCKGRCSLIASLINTGSVMVMRFGRQSFRPGAACACFAAHCAVVYPACAVLMMVMQWWRRM